MKLFDTKYRIVTDKWQGYEAQYRPFWCPIWLQCDRFGGWGCNTNSTAHEAMLLIKDHKRRLATGCVGQVVWTE